MNSPQTSPAPVTRIARRRAQAGHESEYEALVSEMFATMRSSPGFLGADLLPPEQSGDAYQVIVRFAAEADMRQWDASPARAANHS
jgi:antibiotic biosynthesis monooxygenase (ABM) superfamily enzyme